MDIYLFVEYMKIRGREERYIYFFKKYVKDIWGYVKVRVQLILFIKNFRLERRFFCY